MKNSGLVILAVGLLFFCFALYSATTLLLTPIQIFDQEPVDILATKRRIMIHLTMYAALLIIGLITSIIGIKRLIRVNKK
jgi:hypothetical protein